MTGTTISEKLPVGDDVSLVIRAAQCHPDAVLRERLTELLAEWVKGLKPYHSEDAVRGFFASFPGTVIEPFSLKGRNLEVAVLSTQIALSNRMGQTRFRVVGEETVGNKGGLVLTNNLRGYYVERYAYGVHRRSPERAWFVAPAAIEAGESPGPQTKRDASPRAVCRMDDNGYTIEITMCDSSDQSILFDELRVNAGEDLGNGSFVLGTTTSLSQLGLRIQRQAESLAVKSGSPESLMRLTALMAQKATLVIRSETGGPRSSEIYLALKPAPSDTQELAALVTQTQTGRLTRDWCYMEPEETVPLSLEDRLSIAEWTLPHKNWMTGDFVEALS
jgi:hypothetical protein